MLCKEPIDRDTGIAQLNWPRRAWKKKKVDEAITRQGERAARSNAQQLSVLDAGGHVAKRERKRLGS